MTDGRHPDRPTRRALAVGWTALFAADLLAALVCALMAGVHTPGGWRAGAVRGPAQRAAPGVRQ